MRKFSAVLCIILFFAVSMSSSKAVELVTGNNYLPYTDERLPGGGFATILVKAMFDEVGIESNIHFMPWGEGYDAAKNGQFLATFPYIRTPERDVDFLFAVELFVVRPYLFINFNRATGITQLSDLNGKTLCVPKGWGIDSYLTPLTDSGQLAVVDTTNVVGCFQMLYDGKVDAISIDRRLGNAAAAHVNKGNWTKLRRLGSISNPNYLIIPRNYLNAEEWAARLSDAKAKLDADGTTARLLKEYYEAYR